MTLQSHVRAESLSPDPAPLSRTPQVEVASERGVTDNVKVKTYDIASGDSLEIPATKPGFHLVKNPKVASVLEVTDQSFVVQAKSLGETLILVWEAGVVRSYRIRVTRTREQEKIIERSRIESSKLLQSQKDRSFKFRYQSGYELLNEGDVLPRVSESRKVYDHRISVEGATPIGDLRGSLFYEYRKEIAMEKSVAIPRDFYMGFYETNLPLLKNYDIIGGAQYGSEGNYSMPGQRYNGITIEPSKVRVENAQAGQLDFHFFTGLKRDGSNIDNPPGTQNRELEGKVLGEKLDYYLWDQGVVSLGAYHQWSEPQTRFQSKHNFDTSFDFELPYVQLLGEGGLDDENRVAGHVQSIVPHPMGDISAKYFSVDPNYGTITGSTLNRGNRGFEVEGTFYPLLPFTGSEAIRLTGDADWTRNRIASNPNRYNDYNKSVRTKLDLKFPHKITSESLFIYRNNLASSFPYTEKEWKQRLSKEINLNRFLLKRARVFLTSTIESYRDAENVAGFNTTRYELGGGISLHTKGGFWVTSQYLWNRLKEEDLTTPPTRVTNPDQLTVTGGWSHGFQSIPLRLSADIRWVEEGETHSKVHQPFLNEDRLEARASMNWALYDYGSLFMQVRSTIIRPTIAAADRAELSLQGGLRMLWDTGFYLPQSGVIHGYVFEDDNANGIKDPGEQGIMGHEVRLEDGIQTETNSEGYFELRPREGVWRVIGTGVLPEGYFFTTVNWKEVELLPEDNVKLDFGIAPQVQVKGHVFLDVNENGVFEKGDAPMQGIQVALNSGQAGVSTAKGLYSILRVSPGANKVRLVLDSIPEGYRTTTAIEKEFNAAPGDVLNFNVILKAERVIRGNVYIDANGNGRMDPTEQGVPNALIQVGEREMRTNIKGQYFVTGLQPGTSMFRLMSEELPPGLRAELPIQQLEIPRGAYVKYHVDFPVSEHSETKESF